VAHVLSIGNSAGIAWQAWTLSVHVDGTGISESLQALSATHGKESACVVYAFYLVIGYLAGMSYYRYHVFFCTNQRADGSACCQRFDAQSMRDYAKMRSKELDIAGQGRVRINSAGCLDRCAEGPVLVIYPDDVWYSYVDREDIDEIIEQHLVNGRVVERLKI
jgi:(2Fe-2S) ferredoxin